MRISDWSSDVCSSDLMVSGDYVPRNLKCLAEDGRHVTIAVLGGLRAELNMALVMSRRLTLTGSTLRPRSDDFTAALADEIAENAWPLFASCELHPVIDLRFPLADAASAPPRRAAGQHVGKSGLGEWEERPVWEELVCTGR